MYAQTHAHWEVFKRPVDVAAGVDTTSGGLGNIKFIYRLDDCKGLKLSYDSKICR